MKLEFLPQGITGFFDEKNGLPAVDSKRFTAACHAAARDMRAEVRMFDDEGGMNNYFAAVFDAEDASIAALCNRAHPYVGLLPAAGLTSPGPSFLHHAALDHALAKWGDFVLLDADFLNADLRPEMLGALAPFELSQIRYWKPARVGDVIFNFWD